MTLKKTLFNLAISCTAVIFCSNIYAENPVGQKALAKQLSFLQTTASSWAALCSQGQTIKTGCNIPKSATPEMQANWKAVLKATGFASRLGQDADEVIKARAVVAFSIPANNVHGLTATYKGSGSGRWGLYTEEGRWLEPFVMIGDAYVKTASKPLLPDITTQYSAIDIFSPGIAVSSKTSVYALFMGFDSEGKVGTQEDSPIGICIDDGGITYCKYY